jgi:hypothetical protein
MNVELQNQFATDEGKDFLRGLLKTNTVELVFTKKDGSMREMKCTLREDKIPDSAKPKGSNKRPNPNSIAVFDLDEQAWRSFRFDSITTLAFNLGD